jgi:hypothetical protein
MINKRRNHTQSISKPVLKNSTQTTTHASSSTFSNIKDTIVAGFGLGVGNEIAHRAVSSIMGPRTVEIQQSQPISSCQEELKKYEKCLKQNNCMDEQEFYKQCVMNNKF